MGGPARHARHVRRKPRAGIGRAWRHLALGMVLAFGVAGIGVVAKAFAAMPALNTPLVRIGTSSLIYDRYGKVVTQVPGPNESQPVSLDRIPVRMQHAFIAVEDRRFYSNSGIDLRGIARAALADLTGHPLQGGSTITEQLAKNLYLTPTDTLSYKIREVWLALQLAHRYSKSEILDAYLNDIYLGEHAYGVAAAARVYFNRPLDRLTLPQEALLAGLPQEPVGYDPFLHPQLALQRRNIVLRLMAQQGYVTRSAARQAEAAPLGLAARPDISSATPRYKYPWFVDAVVQQLETQDHLTPSQVQEGGLRIYTTLDPKAQQAAQQAVANMAKHAPPNIQVAETVIDPHNGDVVAIIGGRRHTTFLGYDRALQANRQPGSSIKPAVDYIPALQSGLTTGTVVDDTVHAYRVGPGQPPYVPVNDTNRYYGLTTLTEALRRSVNTIAVQILNRVGIENGLHNAQRMGLPLTQKDAHLALALGGTTDCCTTLDMADTYSTIANGGLHVTPRLVVKVVGPGGQVLVNNPVRSRRVLDPRIAYVMTRMLETVDQPQPNHGWDVTSGQYDSNWGTGYDATVQDNVPGWPTAGKTGTTNSNMDAWYVGFTTRYAAAVWVGYDQPRPIKWNNGYGGTDAGPIFKATMEGALAGIKPTNFPRPAGVVRAPIDIKAAPWTVASPGPLTPAADIRNEWFVAGTQPSSPSGLWQACPNGNGVYLARRRMTASWARRMAAVVHQPWRSLLPLDQTMLSRGRVCGAGGQTGNGNGAFGSAGGFFGRFFRRFGSGASRGG